MVLISTGSQKTLAIFCHERNILEFFKVVKFKQPGTKKKKFYLSKGLLPRLLHSYWDGGSRDVYAVVNIHNGRQTLPPTWGGNFDAQGKREYVPVAGDILIQTGCFCGKPATPCLEFREEDESAVKQFLGIV